jgi:hypothetical protein
MGKHHKWHKQHRASRARRALARGAENQLLDLALETAMDEEVERLFGVRGMATNLGTIKIKPGNSYTLALEKECPKCHRLMADHEDLSVCFASIEELEAAGLATPHAGNKE